MIQTNTPYEDAYAAQQLLLIFGFSADDIYVGCVSAQELKNCLTVALRTNDNSFYIMIGDMGDDAIPEEVNQKWVTFAEDIRAGAYTHESLTEICKRSQFAQSATFFALFDQLVECGFHPKVPVTPPKDQPDLDSN